MLSFKEIKGPLYYAFPALAIALLGLPLYVYLPTFYAQDIGFGMFEVGAILFLARFLDVIFDPIIGYISDKYALRKSLMVTGAILLLIGFYFLTHPRQDSEYLWLFSFSVVVYFAWSMITVPYYALGADIGESYHENTSYASTREFFNISGILLALILPYAFSVAENARSSLELMFQTILYVLPFCMVVFTLKVKHKELQKSLISFTESVFSLYIKVKDSKELFISFFLNSFANAVPATLFLLYVELVIGEAQYTGPLLLVYFVSGILALPFWIVISKRYNKKKCMETFNAKCKFFLCFRTIVRSW